MWLICCKGFARSLQLGFLVSFLLQRFDEQSVIIDFTSSGGAIGACNLERDGIG